jgi:hypothetical protein
MSGGDDPLARFSFEATLIHWRGPSPFVFAPVPLDVAAELRRLAKLVTYGWGMLPVEASLGGVSFTTALFPKDETYLLPVKAAVRRKAGITVGDTLTVALAIRAPVQTLSPRART